LYLHLGYPDREREEQIIRLRAPEVDPDLARAVATTVSIVRGLELTKPPSISESVDWARTLHLLGVSELEPESTRRTLPLLLKHQSDIDIVRRELAF
jgi:MoxR-like ATPase